MKLNRKWLLLVALVASLALATTGTLAFLTDHDSEINVFTLGNVDIDLDEIYDPQDALLPGDTETKQAWVENIGSEAAYVWATVAVPVDLEDALIVTPGTDPRWDWTNKTVRQETIEGVAYNVYTIKYTEALAPDAKTPNLLESLGMSSTVDVAPDGSMHLVVDGNMTPIGWNITANGLTSAVHVSAYAIQTTNFANVHAAYSAYNDQWDIDDPNDIREILVHNEQELIDALAEGGYIKFANDITATTGNLALTPGTVVDGGGFTLTDQSSSDALFLPTGGTLKNIQLDGRVLGNVIGVHTSTTLTGDLTLENVKIPTASSMAIGFDANGNSVFVKNCEIANDIYIYNQDLLSFEGCHFFLKPFFNDKEAFIYLLGDMTFTDCHFEEAINFYLDNNGTAYSGILTFTGCTYGNNGVEDRPFEPTVDFFTWWMNSSLYPTFNEGNPARTNFTCIVNGTTVWAATNTNP